MKFLIIGRGHKIVDIPDALNAKRGEVTVVTADETLLRELAERRVNRIAADSRSVILADHGFELSADDLVVVSDYEEASLRETLESLMRQKPPAPVLVLTHLSTRLLSQLYPAVFFKSDRSILRNEMRDLIRRASTVQKVETLRRIAREADRVLVLIWGNPDPDAIASAWALHELVATHARSFLITCQGEVSRPENLAMVKSLRIPIVKFAPSMLGPGVVLATVDAQPSFFTHDPPLKFDIIIDHHPLADLGAPRFSDVRPTYGSTSTIFTEYLVNAATPIHKKLATALFYGLKTDTANLTRNASDFDIAAFRHLRTKVDEDLLRTIELSHMPTAMLDHFGAAIANKRIARDTVFTWLGTVANPEAAVYVADFLIKLSGISWVVVGARTPEKLVVIFRSDGLRKHAGKAAEELFLAYGSAGGHRTMARAEIPAERLSAELPDRSDAAMERWLLARVAAVRKPLAKFLGGAPAQ